MKKSQKKVDYSKWGYVFIAPFFICFLVFSMIPLVDTIKYSFYEYYNSGLKEIGPNFTGLSNYAELFNGDLLKYTWNTCIMWLMGFIPQIVIALVLAAWFTDARIKLYGKQFFKVVIYLPNLIMASAFAMLIYTLFSEVGPINSMLMQAGLIPAPIKFLASVLGSRGLVALMNFMMWFGNSTIMLMAAIMGINQDIFEAAELDGCNHTQIFFKITLPLIKPILSYSLITSLIGGLQMFDVPQILTGGHGTPDRTTMTLIMFLNQHLKAKNYGMAGAVSVYLFVVAGVLCFFVYRMLNTDDAKPKKVKKTVKDKEKGGSSWTKRKEVLCGQS